ncbi:MAG TPA: serine/threonine-protein kinase, partial [Longimicrobium sp.]|nr:serine/threonine-protein kinase [Longimicrobium sp.]
MTGIYSLLEGKTLSGRYRVERLISKGGMGAVFRGTDVTLGRSVAIKVIALEPETPEQAASLRARFRREAHAAGRLRHPNVVTLYDFGTDEAMGLDFIVMELLEGEDVQSRIRRTGPLPWRQASRILYEAARGLAAGHRAGLVHRDVKSANLFLEYDADGKPRTRVLDFGIAQLKAEGTGTATHLTMFGHAPLSPAYASPEQQRGERDLTPAVDVWGLGVTAFEMLTGTLPYAEAQRAALAAGGTVPTPSVRALNPSVPAAADALIRRALSLRPGDRPGDGEAFARELSAIRRAASPTPVSAPADRFAAAPELITSDPEPAAAAPSRSGSIDWARPVLLITSLVVIVGVISNVAPGTSPVGGPDAPSPTITPRTAAVGDATEQQIDHIRAVYRGIENGGRIFRQRRMELGELARREWEYTDSVYATVYDYGGDIQKIRVRVYRGNDRSSLLFYYDAGSLVFVHQVDRSIDSTTDAEARFYFEGPRMIRWRDYNNNIISSHQPGFA